MDLTQTVAGDVFPDLKGLRRVAASDVRGVLLAVRLAAHGRHRVYLNGEGIRHDADASLHRAGDPHRQHAQQIP